MSKSKYFTVFLIGFLTLHYALIIGLSFSKTIQKPLMKRMHLASSSFSSWSFFHLTPWMYNFSNQFLAADGRHVLFNMHLNHYPLRVVTFHNQRREMFDYSPKMDILLRSRYQTLELQTRYTFRNQTMNLIDSSFQND